MFVYYAYCHPTGNIQPFFRSGSKKVHPDECGEKMQPKCMNGDGDFVARGPS
jgi:hypothetical protein